MPTPAAVLKTFFSVLSVAIFCACNNTAETPFPADNSEYAAPVTFAMQFGAPEKLDWPDKPADLTSVPASFDYNGLPVARFDSSGFKPFPQPPEEQSFDWNRLPSADFKYDSLPEIPLRFKTSVLAPPEIARVNRPVLKNGKPEIIYDFGDQLNGIPILNLFKSRDGFTWIGTPKGLYRYDGENLARYVIDGLNGGINNMAEDKEGQLWLSTRSGLFVLDLRNGVSRNLSSKQGLFSDFAVRVMVDHGNRVWATFLPNSVNVGSAITGGCVIVIDQAGKTLKILQQVHGLSTDSPTGVMEDSSQNIWIATVNAGMNIVDLKNNRIRYLDKAHGLNTDTLTACNEDQLGRVWILGFYGEVNIVDSRKGIIKKMDGRQGLPRSFTAQAIQDHLGNTWIAYAKGAIVIDPRISLIKTIDRSNGLNADAGIQLLEDAEHQMLIGNSGGLNIVSKNAQAIRKAGSAQVSTLLEDSHGRIWIGTQQNGIQILDTATGLIKLYNRAHGLSDDLIQYMVEYNGSVLLSTQKGGIEIIDTSLRKIERIGAAQGLTANLTTIEKDKDNNIWLGGLGNGVKVLDLKNKKIRDIGAAAGLRDSAIIDIKKDQKGRLWFYSWTKGIGIIDTDEKTVRHIAHSNFPSLTGAVEDNLLMHDSRGNTWLLTSGNGFFMIHPSGDSVTRFTTAQGMLSNAGTSLQEYHGKIYAGTSRGLNILTPPGLTGNKQWKIESLGRSSGIVKTVATYNSDLLLRNGQYWWGDDGITIIGNLDEHDRDTVAPHTYVTGLDVFNRRQNFVADPWKNVSNKDTIWNNDGKNNGFYVSGGSTSQLSGLNKEGMEWDSLTNEYQLPVNLRLPYNKNYLQFNFAQAHLGAQDTVWYRYILEGIDRKWSEKTNKTSSENYPNISPGQYRFKVSSLYHGRWSTPAVYSFTITPPWWKTWWAYLIYALVAAGILRAYISYRSRKLKRENKLLEEKITLRTTQLQKSIEELKATQSQLVQSEKMASLGELTAGIAHEIQNPLNFINNFSEINMELLVDMKDEIDKGNVDAAKLIATDIGANEEKINHHGRRADSIVKSMLQHSRSNNNAVREQVDINKLADEYLRLSYHGFRAKDKSFNATLKTDFDQSLSTDEKGTGSISILPQDMGRAILNLITNAFYAVAEKKRQQASGYEPTVSVSTKRIGDKVEIRVKDNGNGVPQRVLDKIFQPFFTTKPAGQGTGLGLSLSYDIVKAHGGLLKVETSEGKGSEFIISIPLDQDK